MEEKDNINLKSEIFKNNLYSLINNSNLPVSNVYFIFKLIMQELENFYYKTLNDENQKNVIDNNEKFNQTKEIEKNNEI